MKTDATQSARPPRRAARDTATEATTPAKKAGRAAKADGAGTAPAPVATVATVDAVAARPVRRGAKAALLTGGSLRLVKGAPGEEGGSLVTQAVDALRKKILASRGDNVFLGSEEQLIAALGVSRPTFRQAAKLLRHEDLLVIKRGVGGGFFTHLPTVDAVSRMAAIYLNSQGSSLLQLHDAVSPLLAEAARLVATNPDPAVRRKLREFVEEARASDDRREQVRRVLAFERLLGDLAGNPAISLVLRVMRDVVRDARHSGFTITAERAEAYAMFQRRLAGAVEEGDAEMAVLITERHVAEVRRWLPDGRLAML